MYGTGMGRRAVQYLVYYIELAFPNSQGGLFFGAGRYSRLGGWWRRVRFPGDSWKTSYDPVRSSSGLVQHVVCMCWYTLGKANKQVEIRSMLQHAAVVCAPAAWSHAQLTYHTCMRELKKQENHDWHWVTRYWPKTMRRLIMTWQAIVGHIVAGSSCF